MIISDSELSNTINTDDIMLPLESGQLLETPSPKKSVFALFEKWPLQSARPGKVATAAFAS